MRINYLLIILCSSVSYICFNTSTAWTGCNSSNPVRKSSPTSNHHCPGVPSLWPWQGVPPGLDGLDRGAQPHRHLGHLWLLGLVPILLTAAGGPLLHLENATVSINVFFLFAFVFFKKTIATGQVGEVQDEPSISLLQPDQARRHGKKKDISNKQRSKTHKKIVYSKDPAGRYIVLR